MDGICCGSRVPTLVQTGPNGTKHILDRTESRTAVAFSRQTRDGGTKISAEGSGRECNFDERPAFH